MQPPCWGQSLRPSLAILLDCLNLSDLLAVVQLSLQADLSVRLDICRQVSVGGESFWGGFPEDFTLSACDEGLWMPP